MRLVSLCPSLTELVFDLGRGEDLVGVTRFCVHPAAGVEEIEKVGGTKNPDIGRIVELAPDLVLLNREENRFEDAEALAAAGVECHSSLPRDPGETATMVRSIGAAIGRAREAEKLAHRIEERREAAERRARNRPRVRFAYLVWRKPWMAAGAGTYAGSLLELAGGENVFGDRGEHYPEVEAADLGAAAPAAVLLSSEPFPFTDGHAEELAAATGLPRSCFRLVDGELLSWHGARTPRGIDHALEIVEATRRAQPAGPPASAGRPQPSRAAR